MASVLGASECLMAWAFKVLQENEEVDIQQCPLRDMHDAQQDSNAAALTSFKKCST
jgi:hypothetical protein